jgi:hypothetical protein
VKEGEGKERSMREKGRCMREKGRYMRPKYGYMRDERRGANGPETRTGRRKKEAGKKKAPRNPRKIRKGNPENRKK